MVAQAKKKVGIQTDSRLIRNLLGRILLTSPQMALRARMLIARLDVINRWPIGTKDQCDRLANPAQETQDWRRTYRIQEIRTRRQLPLAYGTP